MMFFRMVSIPLQNPYVKRIIVHQNYFFRFLRSISRHDEAPTQKSVKGKVRSVEQYDDTPRFESYKDFLTEIKKSGLGSEMDVHKQFLHEDYYGDVIGKTKMYHEMHLSEEKHRKSIIKKNVIGRKYFKLDKETTLLTHAAMEQIKYLHKLDPTEWNPKSLSECFPISENGVKRLLRKNFVETCPEKIKRHDEKVAKRWEILKSGKFSDEITPLTWKLYKEGKLIDDYFSGNYNLPTAPPSDKKIIEIKKVEKGEFSDIVKSYISYQKQKLLESGNDTSEKTLSLRDNYANVSKPKDLKHVKKFKYAAEELDDINAIPDVYPSRRRRIINDADDIPFPQFKKILSEEVSYEQNSKDKNKYHDFVMQETSRTQKTTAKEPVHEEDCFSTIPKYKKENIEAMYEGHRSKKNVYKYDEKLGYQYPDGKNIKGRIKISSKIEKGKYARVGQCVYDADGEFLYKVPS